ncbi:MAG: HAMP domain-containing histidine kinase [Gemmatimonadetes bacterium]|jgi:signal transduction histidine kinase|nr:HAMP domain-containing histidine kinase [Gemmatimonadota bacterium]
MQPTPDSLPAPTQRSKSSWTTLLPLVAVIGALVALVLVFVQVERRTRELREELSEIAEPAGTHVYDLQRIYALQISVKRGFLLTGETSLLDRYQELRDDEERAYMQLAPLIQHLGPDAEVLFAELRTQAPRWHATFPEAELRGYTPTPGALAQRLPEQQQLYEATLSAASRLDARIAQRAQQTRARIREIERNERRLGLVLVVLALAGAGVIFQVARRLRSLTEASRRHAEEAEGRRREVESLMEQRTSFIRGITHDLKNPLGAVDAFAQLLEAEIKGPLTTDQRMMVGRMRRATQETLGIIDDLLSLSRAQSGQLRIERRATDVARLVREAAEDYRASIEAAGLALEVELNDGLPPIRVDTSRVRQILGNLLSNAVKYTPEGEVRVRAAERAGDGAPGPGSWVSVDVIDTGLGIPEEEQDNVFGEFHRIHRDQARGVGLGLSISRRIARLLGGDVTVESEVGKGSTFTLWLPLTFPDPAPAQPESPASPR